MDIKKEEEKIKSSKRIDRFDSGKKSAEEKEKPSSKKDYSYEYNPQDSPYTKSKEKDSSYKYKYSKDIKETKEEPYQSYSYSKESPTKEKKEEEKQPAYDPDPDKYKSYNYKKDSNEKHVNFDNDSYGKSK